MAPGKLESIRQRQRQRQILHCTSRQHGTRQIEVQNVNKMIGGGLQPTNKKWGRYKKAADMADT